MTFLCLILPVIGQRHHENVCLANYAREKKLLHKDVTEFEPTKVVFCPNYVAEIKTLILSQTLTNLIADDAAEGNEKIVKAFKKNYSTFIKDCIRLQLNMWNIADRFIKFYVYEHAKDLNPRQKRRFVSEAETQFNNRANIASFICQPEDIFETKYSKIITDENLEEGQSSPIEDKWNLYCLRQHTVVNQLLDSTRFNITLNPDHIAIADDINCVGRVRNMTEWFRDSARTYLRDVFFENESPRLRNICMGRAIENAKIENFYSKLIVLKELELTNDIKLGLMLDFIETNKDVASEVFKCLQKAPRQFKPKKIR